MGQRRFLALDGMRGIAALAVLVIHMGGLPAQVVRGGYLAVDFFFCLSGFVLAHAYGEGSLGLGAFLRLRAIRLYPLYLVGLVFGIASAVFLGVPARLLAGTVALSLFFLPTPFAVAGVPDQGGSLYPLDPPAWSLFFEIVANVVWFAARRWITGATSILVIALCGALFTAAVLAYGVSSGAYWQNIWGGFARVFYSFLLGVLVYRLWRASAWRPRIPTWLPVVGLLALLAAPVNRQIFDPPAVMLAMPVLVFLGACAAPVGRASATLQQALGDASYAIYALHYPVIVLVDRAVSGLPLAHRSLITTPATIVIVVGGALWLDKVYDLRVRRWLLAATSRPRAVVARGEPAQVRADGPP